MKFVRFRKEEKIYCGVCEGSTIRRLNGSYLGSFEITDETDAIDEVKILPPTDPTKVVCVGLNYLDHARELKMPIPEEPILFMKPPTSVIGQGDEIVYPGSVCRLDYEAELGVIIKDRVKGITPSQAKDHILGYLCLNDVTA